MNSNLGLKRFTNQIDKLQETLLVAKDSQNPALTFYKSNARQTLFFLEALSRLYRKMHNEKFFDALKDDFKSLEDQLGKVDYFEAYHEELATVVGFPKKILDYLQESYQQELQKLGNLLITNGWLRDKLENVNQELAKADWLKPDEEREEIAKTLSKEIKGIEKDYESGKLNFKDLETGVHEFRRNIRWISIYAVALNGIIQLKPDNLKEKLSTYLTKETVESKFNVMPAADGLSETIDLSQSAFYALSWMIAKSGDLKDEGLKLICVEESMKALKFLPESEISEAANALLPEIEVSPKEIKAEMKTLAHQFITEHQVLDILKDDLKIVYKD